MTIDEFLECAEACSTVEELGQAFTRAIEEVGYQNVSYVRIDSNGLLELPLVSMPGQFAQIYAECDCERSDPVFAEAATTTQPFYWDDIPNARKLTKLELQTVSVCRDADAHSGLSIPFHGPDGTIDLIGVSLRDATKQDKRATARISALAAIMRRRYWEMCGFDAQSKRGPVVDVAHTGGPPGMTLSHCYALTLISIAERRRAMSLECLSRSINTHVDAADIEFLLEWGYVVERPDDDTFEYRYAPSPLGAQHSATCMHAKLLARNACSRLGIPLSERPKVNER